jgi:UPF0176 protein
MFFAIEFDKLILTIDRAILMHILNIASYKFIPLEDLATLQAHLLAKCRSLQIKGTILLSVEGINLCLSGEADKINAFRAYLQQDARFADLHYRESKSLTQAFQLMKVKIKKEIITLLQPEVDATQSRAPSIAPQDLKQWLDEKRDITLLDTRNEYEVNFGTFIGAMNLHISHFSQLPYVLADVDRNKPAVMFCTGGIRCEKAAIYMLNHGFPEVYQLDGGILNYFAEVGQAHYQGECFVFDERVAVDGRLECLGTVQCRTCQGPILLSEQELESFVKGEVCAVCYTPIPR